MTNVMLVVAHTIKLYLDTLKFLGIRRLMIQNLVFIEFLAF